MKPTQRSSSFLEPKTIVLALSTLFLAGSLSAQSTVSQESQKNEQNASTTRLQPRQPYDTDAFQSFHFNFQQHHKEHGFHRGAGGFSEDLSLTTEQQAQLKAVAKDLHNKQGVLVKQMVEIHTKLNSALYAAQLDKAAIAELQGQKNKLNEELRRLTDNARIQALEVLTAEQRTTLGQQVDKWQQQHQPVSFTQSPEQQERFEWLLLPVKTFGPRR